MAQTTWATAAEVQNITGVSVSDQEVTLAGYVIDNHTGRPYSFSWTDPNTGQTLQFDWWKKVGAADSYWLRLAVAYETVWMKAQPDLMSRMDLKSVPTTRESLQIVDNGMVIGPIVKRALSRVSWLRSRSIHVRSPFEDLYGSATAVFGEELFPWTPIGG